MSTRRWYWALAVPALLALAWSCLPSYEVDPNLRAPGAGGSVPDASGGASGIAGSQEGGAAGNGGESAGAGGSVGGQAGTGGTSSIEPGPSCANTPSCGGLSCCDRVLVKGGDFLRGRGTGSDQCPGGEVCPDWETPEHQVTVADFYLDTFEVTVGRFRNFASNFAVPNAGDGKHPLINDSGWRASWDAQLVSAEELDADLNCQDGPATWMSSAGGSENFPINCVSWYEAFAFCVWDGGRLPTEAEWEYAAVKGAENLLYPWGSAPADPTKVSFQLTKGDKPLMAVDAFAKTDWGFFNLAGSEGEWVLDSFDNYWYADAGATCVNCANVNDTNDRVHRGGHWNSLEKDLRGAARDSLAADKHRSYVGFRCARSP